jgi:FAD binding domain-containing protein/berberine-like enzyme
VEPSIAMLSVTHLADELEGRLITPHDADYDRVRTVFPGNIDHKPALIVQAADTADVARVVALARDNGMELSVRAGGHSPAGHGVSDGGIMLDLRDLRSLEIDPEAQTAWAGGGVTAGDYTIAAAEHGLATPFGDTGSVGIGGITLSGGVGYLVRKHGLTIDDLLAAEVVTADGELVRADAGSHPDLFWALRGGGGNFGVVTRFQYRLHPLGEVMGGMLILPATADVIAGFMAAAEAAPEELSAIANVMPAPPLPFLPPEHHGKLVLMATLVHAGEGGELALVPFRALADPLVDMVRPISYPEIYPPEEPDFHPTAVVRTMFVDRVDRPMAETILERIKGSSAPMAVTQLRVLGGAMARVPADATAFAHRRERIMLNVAAMYMRPEERATHQAWVASTAGDLADGSTGAYAGFLGDEGEQRVRAAYPGATYDRLAAVKAQYDPDNVFRLNHNIQPA